MEWHVPRGQGSRAGCGRAFLRLSNQEWLRFAIAEGHGCRQNAVIVIAEEQDMFATPRLPSEWQACACPEKGYVDPDQRSL